MFSSLVEKLEAAGVNHYCNKTITEVVVGNCRIWQDGDLIRLHDSRDAASVFTGKSGVAYMTSCFIQRTGLTDRLR